MLTTVAARRLTMWGSLAGLLAALSMMALVGCNPVPDQPVPGAATCADACHRGAELDCAWAKATPEGTTCEQVCEHARDGIPWRLSCVVLAESCADADLCGRR